MKSPGSVTEISLSMDNPNSMSTAMQVEKLKSINETNIVVKDVFIPLSKS